jgi:hypothetical protein
MNQAPLPPPPPPGFAPAPQQAYAPAAPAPQAPAYAPPAPPPGYAQGYSYPQPAPAAPAPAYAPAPQGFAPPPPQGFNAQQPVNAPSLNSVAVSDLNLLPNSNCNGVTKFRVLSYVKGMRQSGPAYTIQLLTAESNVQQIPVGATFSLLCKISFDPKKQGGDKTRKKFVAACFQTNANAAVDWDAMDLQLQQRDYNAQPLFVECSHSTNYSRPVLDQNTRQPVPNQWYTDTNWKLAQG